MGRRLGLSVLALGAGVALLVSAASASPHEESTRGGTLRLMWGTEPDSLDPAVAAGYVGSWVLLDATCAKLFTTVRDPDTGKRRVITEVARRSPAITNGGRTYTFELKRTFRFHTGAPVTAHSFADAFHRNANPRMRSPAASRGFLHSIVGADAVIRGKAKRISGVQVLGPYRLRIRLKRPAGDFRARLTMPYFCPIVPGTPIRPIDSLPGSGPYYFADHVPNRRIVLERNPHYPGGRTANPDRIVWTIEREWAKRLTATEQGDNDFTALFAFPDSVVRDLIDGYGVDRPGAQVLRDSPTSSTFRFMFNLDRPAFRGRGQAPLRKAINYALDRPALAGAHAYLAVRRSDRLLPAELSKRRPLYPLGGPNPVLAQRSLALARQRPQTPLKLYMANFPVFSVRLAQVFASNLKQLGIEVDTEYFELTTLVEKVHARGEPWDVAWVPGGGSHPDPAGTFVQLLRGTRHEARMNAVNRLAGAARAKAWADLEADLMRTDPPVAVYADWTPLAFVSRRTFGCWSGADAYIDIATVCRKQRE